MPRLYQRFSRMPTIPQHRLSIGTFYNPHLAQFTLDHPDLIDHLAMADPPTQDDEFFPSIHQQFPLLLHDYLRHLSDPLSESALQRARSPQERYRSPGVAQTYQRPPTRDPSPAQD